MAFDFPNSPAVGQVYAPAGGPSWEWDGIAWVLQPPEPSNTFSMIERFYTAGSTAWNKPAGLKYLEVEGCAAGGGGSAAITTGAGVWSLGAGGAAGAWGKSMFDAAALPASVTVAVGSPGAASAGAGLAGGNASFGSVFVLPGGTGGAQGGNTTSSGSTVTAASAAPTGVTQGGVGPGSSYTIVNRVGISAVGSSGNNMFGGQSPWLYTTAASSIAGVVGTGYGSGGGGAVNGPSLGVATGAGGMPGFIRIREFY